MNKNKYIIKKYLNKKYNINYNKNKIFLYINDIKQIYI